MTRILRGALARSAALAGLWLMGCASVPSHSQPPQAPPAATAPAAPVPTASTASANAARLARPPIWREETIAGRFSVQYQQNGNPQALYGQLVWRMVAANQGELTLSSPLGQTIAVITQSPEIVRLDLPNGVTRYAPDADSLLANTLGVPLPVSGLIDWLYARPQQRQQAQISFDGEQRPQTLQEQGWAVQYVSYHDGLRRNGWAVKRMDVQRTTAQTPLEIRLVLNAPEQP